MTAINLLSIQKSEIASLKNKELINYNNNFQIHLNKVSNQYYNKINKLNKQKQHNSKKDNIITEKELTKQSNTKLTELNKQDESNKQKIKEDKSDLSTNTDSLKKEIHNIIGQLQINHTKQDKITNINKSGALQKNISEILSNILNKLNNQANEHSKLNVELLKELTNLSKKLNLNTQSVPNKEIETLLKDFLSVLNSMKLNNEKTNSKTKVQNNVLQGLLHNLKTIANKKTTNVTDKKELFNSNKITQQVNLANNIRVKVTKDKMKLATTNEQTAKEIMDSQSITQKVDNKLQNTSESENNNNFDLKSKPSSFTQGLKTPKGFTIDNPNELFNQIVNKASMSINNHRSEMLIKLKPQIMGNIRLKVIIEGKEVSGSFFVENKIVKLFLEENISSLKNNIEKQGLQLDNINILLEDKSNKNLESKMNSQSNNNTENNISRINSNIPRDEEIIMSHYAMPDWLAKEVDLII